VPSSASSAHRPALGASSQDKDLCGAGDSLTVPVLPTRLHCELHGAIVSALPVAVHDPTSNFIARNAAMTWSPPGGPGQGSALVQLTAAVD
jgi:hypothetical protein